MTTFQVEPITVQNCPICNADSPHVTAAEATEAVTYELADGITATEPGQLKSHRLSCGCTVCPPLVLRIDVVPECEGGGYTARFVPESELP